MSITAVADTGLGNTSYIVDLGDGSALLVDPPRDIRPHLKILRDRRLRPRIAIETHLHADFVSGAGELVAIGAQWWAPAGSPPDPADRHLRDDEVHPLGGYELSVIATPGHTPEHLAYLLTDGGRPTAVFTGGTLIGGGVARTDLLSQAQTEPLARAAYRSITERLFALPDDVTVHPTHGAGSFCSTGTATSGTGTIGGERRTHPLVSAARDEDEFVERLLAGYGTHPPYFLELRDVNQRGVEVFGASGVDIPRLTPEQVESASGGGAAVVDLRSVEDFGGGHVPGSLSIAWRPQFGTWLGWLVDRQNDVIVVLPPELDPVEVFWAAATVGYEQIIGVLDGGVEAWAAEGRPVERTEIVTEAESNRLEASSVLDVRQRSERQLSHVPGSLHVELGSISKESALGSGGLIVHCGHGERAMTAASILQALGRSDVAVWTGSPEELAAARGDGPVTG